ncbi:MAG: Ldh family oxidoreductase [Hyphomicrobiaceae bacterium]
MSERMVLVDAAALVAFCRQAFETTGMAPEHAAAVAANLVEADLRGVESHGVVRLPIYVERLTARANNPSPVVHTVRETRTTAVIDGDNGMGQWVGMRAMEVAIDKARREGEPSWVTVRNSNHFGAAALYAEMAVAAQMIGLAFTIGGINHMVPWGGAEAMLGNNPFAMAFPAGRERPVVLDMACSVAARGKIIVAAKEGRPIPADWAIGPDGAPTADAAVALQGFVAPVGGPKGYALTLAIGLMSTMLSGAAFGSEVTHMYEDLDRPQNVGHAFAALPVAAFEDPDHYARRMEKAIADIRGVKRADGVARVYLPGEREALLMEQRRVAGVPIGVGVFDELAALGRARGLELAIRS